MKRLFETLAADGRHRDFLLWAGVGDGSWISAARAIGAGDVLYIEPHPGLRERLLARQVLAGNEMLSDRPLWRAKGPVVFHLANDASSSSLLPLAGGAGSRPNVRVVEERAVEADGLDSAMAGWPASGEAGLLILDVGGASAHVLEGAAQDTLGRFDTIVVPARECERVRARLGQDFGEPLAVHEPGGNEWMVFYASAASERPDLQALRGELDASLGETDALRAQLAELSAHLETTTAMHAEQFESARRTHAQALETLEAGHAEALARLREQVAAIAEERDAANAALSKRIAEADQLRADIATAASESAQAMAGIAADRDAHAARALDLQQKLTSFSNEAQQTIAALTRERDTANGALAEATAAVARVESGLQQARARTSALEQELVEARQVSTLSVKLQAQREADLADLQARYRESQAIQARQRDLLEKIGSRLSVASHYFHQLAGGRGASGRDGDAIDAALRADFQDDRG